MWVLALPCRSARLWEFPSGGINDPQCCIVGYKLILSDLFLDSTEFGLRAYIDTR